MGYYLACDIIKSESEWPGAVKAKYFVSRQWLKNSSGTTVGVVPPKICPKLSMINYNKNKDGKYRLNLESMPEKNVVERDLLKLDTDDQGILTNYPFFPSEDTND